LAPWSLAGPRQSAAQDPPAWTTYANGDDVRALALKDGYVWAGTKGGGVVRWDSNGQYRQYLRPQDGLAGNDVRDIALGPDGRLWFATDRGVSVLAADGQSWTTYNRVTTNGALSSDNVTAIAISSGVVWIGTAQFWDGQQWAGGGVHRLQGAQWTRYSVADGLPSNNVTDIAIDPRSGDVWVTTRRYRVYEPPTDLTEGGWKLQGGGVAVFKAGAWTAYTRDPSVTGTFPSSDDVNCVAIDSRGRKWFGLTGGGLNALDGSDWYSFTETARGLADNIVLAIAIDPLDQVWAATVNSLGIGSGVSVLNHRSTLGDKGDDLWYHYTTSDGLASNVVRAIVTDGVDRAWFGTSARDGDGYGVSRLDGGSWFTLAMAGRGGLPSNFITAMAFDGSGRLWVGTQDRGIAILDAGSWIRHTKESTNGGLPSDHVTGLAFDPSGRAWVATEGVQWDNDRQRYVDGGVAVYDGGDWTSYNLEKTARRGQQVGTVSANTLDGANRVPASFPDRGTADAAFENGYLMFGDDPTLYGYMGYDEFSKAIKIAPTLQAGVLFGTPIYSVNLGVADNRLSAITVGDGRVWVGTGQLKVREGAGVSFFDLGSQTWENFRYPTIASNLITDIAMDEERHRVWLAATYWNPAVSRGGGVSVYEGGTWTSYDRTNSDLLAYVNTEGGIEVYSIAVGGDGEVWVGAFDFTESNYSSKSAVDAVINRFKDGGWGHVVFEDEGYVSSIAVDHSGRVWAATSRERQGPDEDALQQPYAPLGGVKVWANGDWTNPANWKTYNVDNSGLVSNDIRRIAVDPEGRLWFASYRYGLSLLGSRELPPADTPTPIPPATNTPVPTRTATVQPTLMLPGVHILPSPTPTPGPAPAPPSEVPEAGTLVLLGSGLASLAGYAALRRHRRPVRS